MYVSNFLTLLPLLSLYIDFLRGEVKRLFFFLWLGARYNKRGGWRAKKYQSFRGGMTTNKRLLVIHLPQQQELQDGFLPYINQVQRYASRSSRSCKTTASFILTSIAIKHLDAKSPFIYPLFIYFLSYNNPSKTLYRYLNSSQMQSCMQSLN